MKPYVFVVCLLCFATCLSAKSFTIVSSGFTYVPSQLSVAVGDTINWESSFASHPLISTEVPSGADPFSCFTGTSFQYVIKASGNYAYKCANHGDAFGMKGVIIATGNSDVEYSDDVSSEVVRRRLPDIELTHLTDRIRLTIKADRESDLEIRVMSYQGRALSYSTWTQSEPIFEISTSEVCRGVMLVVVSDANGLSRTYTFLNF